MQVQNACPQCRSDQGFKKGHKLVRQLLSQVLLCCPNKKFHGEANGICDVVLKYEEMVVHLKKKCPFRIVKCQTESCSYSDFARSMPMHEAACRST